MSTREESYSGYPLWIVPLTGGDAPEPDGHPNAVRIYADENQDLRTIKSDGTDAPIGGGGSGVLQLATVALTNAQVLALPTTPVEIVAAPGANKLLLFSQAFLRLVWTADYTNINAGVSLGIALGPNNVSELDGSNDVGGLLSFGENGTALMWPLAAVAGSADLDTGLVAASVLGKGGFDDEPNLVDQPLTLTVNNASAGDFTDGDPANVLQVYLIYAELTLS